MSSVLQTQPFFSIIVPTYNRSKRVVEAIDSILNQDFANYEIIVVDDGSTDDTRQVVQSISSKDSRVNYFFKANEERSIARNYGIEKSSGKYIGFLDSDDRIYSNHLMVAYQLLEMHKFPEVGHLGYEVIDAYGKTILTRNDLDESFKKRLIHENVIHGNAIFVRRDVIREVNFIPSPLAILSEDWYVWLRLAARYPFYFDNTVTSVIVQHEGRSLNNIDPDKLIASTNTIVAHLKKDDFFLREYRRTKSRHFSNHYIFVALMLALTKSRRPETIKYLLIALFYDPSSLVTRRFFAPIKHLL